MRRVAADDPACCGACAHVAAGGEPRPATPPLRFELGPDGVPRGAVIVLATGPVPIVKREVVIGRAAACDVVIPDVTMSRRTCSISFDADGRCFVTDLDSACGVVVGDRRITRAGLHETDRVYIGSTIFTVERRDSP
jgi:pSer/pThr/pTyr-binding forkhead associated (FHA) protein